MSFVIHRSVGRDHTCKNHKLPTYIYCNILGSAAPQGNPVWGSTAASGATQTTDEMQESGAVCAGKTAMRLSCAMSRWADVSAWGMASVPNTMYRTILQH